MAKVVLTDNTIRAAKWEDKDYRLGDGNGLYLSARRSSKTWIIRCRHGGRTQIITLGK
jgi:hypothetical protein